VLPRFDARDRGNAPAEFVLVGALLVALTIAVLQLSLIVHVRLVLQASAWEGARHASYYNTTLSDGLALTRHLIRQGVGERYSENVTALSTTVAGRPGVELRVEAPFPALGLWSPAGELSVKAAVPYEIPG
jgi:Flp pilus assembly protein TadG